MKQSVLSRRGKTKSIIKCAFYGLPGAGKSTSVQMLIEKAVSLGWWVRCVKFAAPLYDAQAEIYRLVRRPLVDKTKQDGKLLNFLGGYFRIINKEALTEHFSLTEASYLEQFKNQGISKGLLLNDDMRASEAAFLKSRGFHLTQIMAESAVCHARRQTRGDITIGSFKDPTEEGIETVVSETTIINDGTLSDLDLKITQFLNKIMK